MPGSIEHGWLGKFRDPQLQAFVAEALAYNADLRTAAARMAQAEAYVKVAGGHLWPAVNFLGRTGLASSADDSGLKGVLVSASWELDLWGRVRYGAHSAEDQYFAAQEDYRFARQSLAALVAKSWFLAIETSLQRDLAARMVGTAGTLMELAQERERVGIGSRDDVSVARQNLASYQDNLLQLGLAREQAIRALEVLLGRYPAAEIVAANRLPQLDPATPVGLPSQLLERRPDIIAAERRLGAAFNRIQEARAARLPSLSLTGSVSDLTSDLFVLQDRAQPQWGLGAKVLAPLFTGGALQAQVAVRTAEQNQALAAYASTALKAFSDVEDALAGESTMRLREGALTLKMNEAAHAVQFAEVRDLVGSADLRAVQEQFLILGAAQMNLISVQAEQCVQRVNLHLALGGDY